MDALKLQRLNELKLRIKRQTKMSYYIRPELVVNGRLTAGFETLRIFPDSTTEYQMTDGPNYIRLKLHVTRA